MSLEDVYIIENNFFSFGQWSADMLSILDCSYYMMIVISSLILLYNFQYGMLKKELYMYDRYFYREIM